MVLGLHVVLLVARMRFHVLCVVIVWLLHAFDFRMFCYAMCMSVMRVGCACVICVVMCG